MAEQEEMRARAKTIVKHHAAMAAGFGMMPVPYADMAAVVAVQINMMRELSTLYGVPFEKERGRIIIAGLLGGGLPFAATGLPLLGSTLKLVPVVGSVLGAAIMPGLSTATTIALGRIFTKHFEGGGTLLDFNIESMRKAFKGEMAKAKQDATDIEAEAARTAETPSAA
ncbi:YcjF family protein [Arenibaculum pallidiluteum]|uniref:YcjF family protein n=1 Tax=Arenibaculum pallidiluteum TaxID=2812559 RepID=UPI001A956820|nr:DUF697 domain-containing protein [Arenibaculum pallidiluteum]